MKKLQKAELELELQETDYWIRTKPREHRFNWTNELEKQLNYHTLRREILIQKLNPEFF